MTRQGFNALVQRLERQAQQKPRSYSYRVLMLALLGNAYLAAILGLLAALIIALAVSVTLPTVIVLKLIIILGPFLWIVLNSIWVTIPSPTGQRIWPEDAPGLFALIADLRKKLDAPRFQEVLLTDEFNASVAQVPQLGVFGWHRNYLLLGLPLMKSLTEAQFKAVLAHEFGHLAKGHGRVSNWIYRQRLRWDRLITALERNESKGGFLFKLFFHWYGPYFNAYSFPLARANEYEADRTASRLTSPADTAQALTGLTVIGCYLDRYWKKVYQHAADVPQPGFAPYAGMAKGVATEIDAATAGNWMQQALARRTTLSDTHPALTERLNAIGQSAHFAPPTLGQAADQLLSRDLAGINDAFDRRWQVTIKDVWEERHREVQEGRRRLVELQAQHDSGAKMTWQETLHRALLIEAFGREPDQGFMLLREMHQQDPANVTLCYHLGISLLERDDDTGVALVQQAIKLREDWLVTGAQALCEYNLRLGREEEADAWDSLAAKRAALEYAAAKERSELLITDKFDPHGLPEQVLSDLCAQLQSIAKLRKAYFVRKRVAHFPEKICYVLGFTVSGIPLLGGIHRAAEVETLIHEKVTLPGQTLTLWVEGNNHRFRRRFHRRESRIV